MKQHEILFSFLRLPLDIVLCFGSFFAARGLRESEAVREGLGLSYQTIQTLELSLFALAGTFLVVVSFAFARLYQVELTGSRIREMSQVTKTTLIAFFIYVGVIYFTNGILYETPLPRALLVLAFLLVVISLILERIILNTFQMYGLRKGWYESRRLLLITGSDHSMDLHDVLHSPLYEVVGCVGKKCQGIEHLGSLEDLKKIIKKKRVNDVFCLRPDLTYEQESDIIRVVMNHGIKYRYLTHLSEVHLENTDIQLVGDTPLVEIRSSRMTLWGRIIKRVCDISLGLLALMLTSPILLVCIFLIRKQTPGSPWFVQLRVGKNGRLFRIYKLRSMFIDAESQKDHIRKKNQRMDGPLFKIDEDPRITKIGRWMRRYSIDELPNLVNVIKGDMSLIGPRPHLPEEVKNYTDDQKRVLTVKPGVTGMAQVNGRHSNTFAREVELDIFYIEHWSLILDAKIFLKTVRAMFGGK